MMKKLLILFFAISTLSIFTMSPIFADEISFSGGKSSIVLREGRENVVLSDGAEVKVGTLAIKAETITLSGESWRYVECQGGTTIEDEERGISISTNSIWYDREEERLLISSWFEIEDTVNEVSATGASLEYRMKEESLQLDKSVSLMKITDSGLMRCNAESVLYDREKNTLSLRGGASVVLDGDKYSAEVVNVDLNTDKITLEGRIRGNMNG